MHDRHDAFGRALLDTYLKNGGFAVIERDDGLTSVDRPFARYFATFTKWGLCERRAIRLVRGRVLDIGAGAGRHSLYLQNKGFRVTAIDPSPAAVELGRLRGIRDVREKSLADLTPCDGRFDTILMFGNNFGLFGSFREARKLLRMLAQLTSRRGQILATSTDPYRTTDPVHLAYHRRNRSLDRMSGQLRLRVKYKLRTSTWFDYLLVSEAEMRQIVEGTGWEVGEILADDGPAYVARLVKCRDQRSEVRGQKRP